MLGKGKVHRQVDREMFTMYDSKTESYNEPVFAINKHDVVRMMLNLFRDPQQQEKNKFFVNAEDYSLFKIGDFCLKTGTVVAINPPEHVANMHELRSVVEKERPRQRAEKKDAELVQHPGGH